MFIGIKKYMKLLFIYILVLNQLIFPAFNLKLLVRYRYVEVKFSNPNSKPQLPNKMMYFSSKTNC